MNKIFRILSVPLLLTTLIAGNGQTSPSSSAPDSESDLLHVDIASDNEAAFRKFIKKMPDFKGTTEERAQVEDNFRRIYTDKKCGPLRTAHNHYLQMPVSDNAQKLEKITGNAVSACQRTATMESKEITDILLPTEDPNDKETLHTTFEEQSIGIPAIGLAETDHEGSLSETELTATFTTINKTITTDDGDVHDRCIRIAETSSASLQDLNSTGAIYVFSCDMP